jgi:hypothetical protein
MRLLRSVGLFPLLIGLFLVTPVHAQGPHDVAGFYSMKNVNDLGSQVRVTLLVRLANTGEADLSTAKLSLRSSLPARKDHGAIAPLSLRPHGNASFTQDFTISRTEYEMWKKGARPSLSLSAQTAGGKTFTRTIKLLPMQAQEAK